MSKNKLSGDSRIKLSQNHKYSAPLECVSKTNLIAKNASFRLRSIDIERLETVIDRVNNVNVSIPIKSGSLIRGLIYLAYNYEPDELLKAIKNSA